MLKPGQIIKEFVSKKGDHIVIRFIDNNDAPNMRRMKNNIIAELDPESKKVTLKDQEKLVQEMLQGLLNKKEVLFCAITGSEIIGRCLLTPFSGPSSHMGEISLSIIKEFREEGIGTALIKEACGVAKDKLNLRIIDLCTDETNIIALDLYRKLGFQKYGVIPKGHLVKNKYVDKIFMYKEL